MIPNLDKTDAESIWKLLFFRVKPLGMVQISNVTLYAADRRRSVFRRKQYPTRYLYRMKKLFEKIGYNVHVWPVQCCFHLYSFLLHYIHSFKNCLCRKVPKRLNNNYLIGFKNVLGRFVIYSKKYLGLTKSKLVSEIW